MTTKKINKYKHKTKEVTITIRITKEQKKFLEKNEINVSLLLSTTIDDLMKR